ncbi:MAG: hypothetical protein ACJ788_03180 [Ktedonobacteraceae bacterium]
MTQKQRHAYEAYRDECDRTDAGAQGSLLREHTATEQALYDAWQGSLIEDDETEQESEG